MRPRHALYVRGMYGRCLVYKPYILLPSRTPPLVSPVRAGKLCRTYDGIYRWCVLRSHFVAVEATVISVVIVVVAIFVMIVVASTVVIFTVITAAIVIVAILVVIVVIAITIYMQIPICK